MTSSGDDDAMIDRLETEYIPFGRAKTPLSEPRCRALLNWVVKAASLTPERLLLAWTYFLMAWRLQTAMISNCNFDHTRQ